MFRARYFVSSSLARPGRAVLALLELRCTLLIQWLVSERSVVVTGCVCLRISEEVWLSPGSPRGYHMTCMNAMKSKLVLYDVNMTDTVYN